MAMKRIALTIEEERARRTLDLFKRLRNMSDQDIATAAGWSSHQSVQQRRYGTTRIHPWRDIPRLAQALRVDPDCFRMDDDELLDWVKNVGSDLLIPSFGWLHRTIMAA